jgi:hypothetical protein
MLGSVAVTAPGAGVAAGSNRERWATDHPLGLINRLHCAYLVEEFESGIGSDFVGGAAVELLTGRTYTTTDLEAWAQACERRLELCFI